MFSGKGYVSAKTKEKVMRVAQGFSPRHPTAVSTDAASSHVIGIIVSQRHENFFQNTIYSDIMLGISSRLLPRGYHLLMVFETSDSAMLIDMYARHRVDGFILIGMDSTNPVMRDLSRASVPMVLIGECTDNADIDSCAHVDIDDFAAARDITSFLITLGHRRIAYIAYDYKFASSYNRFLGYKSALTEAGLPFDERFVVTLDNMNEERTVNVTKHLLYQAEKPTAILALNGVISMTVYKAIADCGLSIPEDISVAGFDDNVFARHVSPAMTTVWQPSVEKGETAAEILLEALDAGVLPTKIVTMPSMILYRSSCSPPASEAKSERSAD